jgi:hypothetical protein
MLTRTRTQGLRVQRPATNRLSNGTARLYGVNVATRLVRCSQNFQHLSYTAVFC